MSEAAVSFEIDQRSLNRAIKTLDKYRGRPLEERLRRATLQAARMLVPPIRDASPVGPTGNLKRSVKAWTRRTRLGGGWGAHGLIAGRTLAAGVGPTAPHRHLVIRPHRIVTPGGRDTGRKTTGNPYVDAAIAPRKDAAIAAVSKILFEK